MLLKYMKLDTKHVHKYALSIIKRVRDVSLELYLLMLV